MPRSIHVRLAAFQSRHATEHLRGQTACEAARRPEKRVESGAQPPRSDLNPIRDYIRQIGPRPIIFPLFLMQTATCDARPAHGRWGEYRHPSRHSGQRSHDRRVEVRNEFARFQPHRPRRRQVARHLLKAPQPAIDRIRSAANQAKHLNRKDFSEVPETFE